MCIYIYIYIAYAAALHCAVYYYQGLNGSQEEPQPHHTGKNKRQKECCDGQQSPALTNSTEHSTELDTDEENDNHGRPVGFSSISASPILPPDAQTSGQTLCAGTRSTTGDDSSDKIGNPLCTVAVSPDSLHRPAPQRP